MYVCTYIYTHVHIDTYMCIRTYIYIYTYTYLYVYVYMYVHIHIYIYTCICIIESREINRSFRRILFQMQGLRFNSSGVQEVSPLQASVGELFLLGSPLQSEVRAKPSNHQPSWKARPVIMGYFQSAVRYIGAQWSVISSYLVLPASTLWRPCLPAEGICGCCSIHHGSSASVRASNITNTWFHMHTPQTHPKMISN